MSNLKRLWRSLADEPLDPVADIDRYVQLYDFPGWNEHYDPVAELCRVVDWSVAGSVQLLSGFRGVGKTTELFRLRHELQDQGYVVVYLDTLGWLDQSKPLRPLDFFASLSVGLLAELEDAGLLEGLRERDGLVHRLNGFLSGIKEVKAGPVTYDVRAAREALRSFRDRLDEAADEQESSQLAELHEFFGSTLNQVADEVGARGKVVVLVDSIEKHTTGSQPEEFHRAARRLFTDYVSWLRFDDTHLVYTVPPYLTMLQGGHDASVHTFYANRLRDRDGSPVQVGLDAYAQVIGRRYPRWLELLGSRERLDRLALASGGQLRAFFFLLRQMALGARRLPFDDEDATFAEQTLRRDLGGLFSTAELDWLRMVATTHTANLDVVDLSRIMSFLDSGLMLCYRNHQTWYDVHPMLRVELGLGQQ